MRRTGLQRHVQSCSSSRVFRFPQGLDFRVEMSCSLMPSSSDDAPARYDYGANGGIRMRAAQAFARFKNRLAHEFFVSCHRHNSLGTLRPAFNGKRGRER